MSATLGGAFGIAMYTTIFATLQVSNSASVAAAWSMITGVSLMIIGIIVAQIIIPKNIKA